MKQAYNWGGHPATPQHTHPVFWLSDLDTKKLPAGPLLAHGNSRSQGDVGLNSHGTLLLMRGCNRLLNWDAAQGLLTAESGMTLHEILEFAVPRGFMLPVVPGTRFVTLGGAIANDVHGKNHHAPITEGGGSFGHHVQGLGLWRTDGGHLELIPTDSLFKLTIGGLGLTGIITHATIKLVPLAGPSLTVVNHKMANWGDMIAGLMASTAPYSVAWLDLSAPTAALGRGWLEEATWPSNAAHAARAPRLPTLGLPAALPFNLWQPPVVRGFNALWFKKPRAKVAHVPYAKFLWPLDGLGNWRHSFGPASFVQCQMVVPQAQAEQALLQALQLVRLSGEPTFLNTLKRMGDHAPAGALSFPRAGLALALDLKYTGTTTQTLLQGLEEIAQQAGGAIYPAKDNALSAAAFQTMYPRWAELEAARDPRIGSDFWARVAVPLPAPLASGEGA